MEARSEEAAAEYAHTIVDSMLYLQTPTFLLLFHDSRTVLCLGEN
jgi:hypothetical protein